MNLKNLSPVPAEEPDFHYGRSLIYTIRRHGAGQSFPEAAEAAQKSAEKAALRSQR